MLSGLELCQRFSNSHTLDLLRSMAFCSSLT